MHDNIYIATDELTAITDHLESQSGA